MDRAPLVETSPPAACRRPGLRIGCSRCACRGSLRLLPSGPDLVHKPTPRGTRAIDAPSGGATGAKPLGGEFSPARADCGYRAPLHPRLARSTSILAREPTATPAPGRRTSRLRGLPPCAPPATADRPYALGCRAVNELQSSYTLQTFLPRAPRPRRARASPSHLIAGCGSSGSSTITIGNESDASTVPHVKGETTPTTAHARPRRPPPRRRPPAARSPNSRP